MRHLLAIEASTGSASMAVIRGDATLLAEFTFAAQRTMARRLVPLLDTLLRSVDLAPDAIDALAVGLGPGSFTSLRVALATIKGIALGAEQAPPVLGVGSLEVLAAGAPLGVRRPVCAVIAAPKRSVYAAVYARVNEDLTNCLFGPALLETSELADRLAAIGQDVVVVGPTSAADRELLTAAGASFLPAVHDVPRAAVLAHLALGRLNAGERHDAGTLTPLYIHPSEPEVKLGQTFARAGGPDDAGTA
ncbi:MAG: tRNA (adenosine(37)-N6)-threonylcarbamoyltransferase complex dimerization subunit type 1 TsaB [Armatimonadetes bacterium]|nr:tRNA (adenosine(37)-N6)-threonylcarbamoyltransferase complex dimerization subunit type 1 TsaB [Armatimonadota bacterium]